MKTVVLRLTKSKFDIWFRLTPPLFTFPRIHYFVPMFAKGFLSVLAAGLLVSCYNPPRECRDFKEGTFRFTALIDGQEQTTTFVRNSEIEIDYFEGRADTSSIRWINDCEYIVRALNPKDKNQEKSIHMKILSTTDSSYTFEYGVVGDSRKSKGVAVKVD